MTERKKILWLVSWYPNKLAPYEGDFIQRHARAVAILHDIEVIFVKKDEKGVITNRETEEVDESWPGLTERIIYYNPSKTKIIFLNKILSDTAYRYFYKLAILRYLAISGKPDLVHLHVAMKAGMLALWLKKKRQLNYILTEHWTGYLPLAKPNIDDFSAWYKTRWKDIVCGAAKITVVSKVLGEALEKRFRIKNFSVIPNVVDTSIFYPAETEITDRPTFIHVSSLEDQKNPETIIEAFSQLRKEKVDFSLLIFGPVNLTIRDLVHKKDLSDHVKFKDEVPQKLLAEDMRKCDALVLFSRYETFGCVVIEANACGIPAILSDLEVFKEYSVENVSALFAKQGDPNSLADQLKNFIRLRKDFNKKLIAEFAAANFSFEVVAGKFDQIYQDVILKNDTGIPSIT